MNKEIKTMSFFLNGVYDNEKIMSLLGSYKEQGKDDYSTVRATIFKNKQDGNITKAFETMNTGAIKIKGLVEVDYVDNTYFKEGMKPGLRINIMNIRPKELAVKEESTTNVEYKTSVETKPITTDIDKQVP